MEDIIVFLGSDHVIQAPSLNPTSRDLLLYTDKAAAAACCPFTAGVLNAYLLNAAKLSKGSVSRTGESGIRLLSQDALPALSFLGAGFITH